MVVTKIFSRQDPKGYWEDAESPYRPKYKSSYWQVIVLGHLGMDKSDDRVRRACEHVFRFQQDEGGFSSAGRPDALREYEWHKKRGKRLPAFDEWTSDLFWEQQLSCLTGNMCAALIRLGYAGDPRVERALEWLVRIQNSDGGWLCPYWKAHAKDRHGCFMGTICSLEGLSEVPEEDLTKEMRETIAKGAEFLLMHRMFKSDHHGYKVIKDAWLELGFPWFAGYNVLRGLDVLTKLGCTRGERLADAVEFLVQQQRRDGRWLLETAPNGRMQTNLESVGRPSKWITLIALRILKRMDMICNLDSIENNNNHLSYNSKGN